MNLRREEDKSFSSHLKRLTFYIVYEMYYYTIYILLLLHIITITITYKIVITVNIFQVFYYIMNGYILLC